jgi:hypothetical protein
VTKSAHSAGSYSGRGLAEQSFDQHRVLPFAVEAAVAALIPDLGEARPAVEPQLASLGREDAARELVVAGGLGGGGELVQQRDATPFPRACGST